MTFLTPDATGKDLGQFNQVWAGRPSVITRRHRMVTCAQCHTPAGELEPLAHQQQPGTILSAWRSGNAPMHRLRDMKRRQQCPVFQTYEGSNPSALTNFPVPVLAFAKREGAMRRHASEARESNQGPRRRNDRPQAGLSRRGINFTP